ncbi:hypothetical protein HF521_005181 [Silurus meridionalis]|uniref:Uncharacterized protein n=2 Tax=Silurus meridionalis TaxID=175797 RepID=A0A8T0AWX7_SILME|nr:hypothetical protein HF521_005181 [Silurus meridionalis]
MADCLPGPSCSSHECNSMETLPEASVPVSALPRKQGSGRRAAGSMRSQSSLVERAGVGRRASKENDRALRAQLQDGVVTPETDSGFVGSESSRLTPAAQSPVQQMSAVRATRPSVVQEKCQINPKSSSPAHKEPSSNPSCAHTIAPGGVPGSLRRRGETRTRHIPSSFTSSSPLCWQSTPFQAWPSGEITEPEQQSECARSLSEDGTRQGVLHTQPSNRDPSYLTSSSFTAPYHHGDHLKAQSSGQLANHHEAIGSLQAEVHRLREHLQGALRTATRCPSKNNTVHIPPYTSTPHLLQHDFRSLERKTASKREPKANGRTVKGEQERTIPRRRSASVPRLRPEPDSSTDTELTHSEDMTPKVRAETGQSPKIHTHWRKRSISADRSKVRHDEAEGRERPVHETLCSSCLARYHRSSECHARNVNSLLTTRYYSSQCSLCGAPKRDTVSPPANQSFIQKKVRPPRAKHMQPGALYMAVAPPPPVIGSVPMLQCVPVCPSVLYYSSPVVPTSYQKPFYVSLSDGRGSGGHRRRSQSVDAQRSLNRSLGRAITTASSVREMSQRMVRSLSSGLNHMSPLAKSCTY